MPMSVEHNVATMKVFCARHQLGQPCWEKRQRHLEVFLLDHIRVIHRGGLGGEPESSHGLDAAKVWSWGEESRKCRGRRGMKVDGGGKGR